MTQKYFNVMLILLLTITSINYTMESDWEITPDLLESDWEITPPLLKKSIVAPSLQNSIQEADGTIKELYSNNSAIIKHPNGRIDTHHSSTHQEEEHPDGTRVYRNFNKETTILPNGTKHLVLRRLIGEDEIYPEFFEIRTTIHAVPTILTKDNPNYIPTPYTQLPAGSAVGSFHRNHYTSKKLQKSLEKQTKVKTIAFPDGSFIAEDDTERHLFEYHTKKHSLLHRMVPGNPKKYFTLTTTPKSKNPYDIIPRVVEGNPTSDQLRNPIAQILKLVNKK